jgi:hypothetical protein
MCPAKLLLLARNIQMIDNEFFSSLPDIKLEVIRQNQKEWFWTWTVGHIYDRYLLVKTFNIFHFLGRFRNS